MAWLCVNGNGKEIIFEVKPKRSSSGRYWELRGCYTNYSYINLKKGTIEKIVGRKITWNDDPIRI